MTRLISTYATDSFATVDDAIILQAVTYDPFQRLNSHGAGARNLTRRHRDVDGLISVEDLDTPLPAWLTMALAILLAVTLVILLGFGWVIVTQWVHVGLNRAAGVAAASDAIGEYLNR